LQPSKSFERRLQSQLRLPKKHRGYRRWALFMAPLFILAIIAVSIYRPGSTHLSQTIGLKSLYATALAPNSSITPMLHSGALNERNPLAPQHKFA